MDAGSVLAGQDAALQKKVANLIDHCSSIADKARSDPVQRFQKRSTTGKRRRFTVVLGLEFAPI
jgi:hypothetical protein